MPKHNIRGVEVDIPNRDDTYVTTDVIIIVRSVGTKSDGAPLDDRLETYYSDIPGIVLTGMIHGAHAMDTAAWHDAHNSHRE